MSRYNPNQIQELAHRLQALEADIHEAGRARLISQADYQITFDRIKRAMTAAMTLKNHINSKPAHCEYNSQVDLPLLPDQSRHEQKIVAYFISQTHQNVLQMADLTRRTTETCFEASNGITGLLRGMWRLSRLRRQMRQIEDDLDRTRRARTVVENFIAKNSMTPSYPTTKTRQQDLLATFHDFDAVVSRVSALRTRLRSEIVRNADMRLWLNRYATQRRQQCSEMTPPEPSAVSYVAEMIADHLTSGSKLANDRLVVARNLAAILNPPEQAVSGSPVTTPLRLEKNKRSNSKSSKSTTSTTSTKGGLS